MSMYIKNLYTLQNYYYKLRRKSDPLLQHHPNNHHRKRLKPAWLPPPQVVTTAGRGVTTRQTSTCLHSSTSSSSSRQTKISQQAASTTTSSLSGCSIFSDYSVTMMEEKMNTVSLTHATSDLISSMHWQEKIEYFQQTLWDIDFLQNVQGSGKIVAAVVKYVSGDYSSNKGRYHVEAGRQNIGPKLFATANLPGGISMIVMEYLAETDGWITLESFINTHQEQLQNFSYIKDVLINAVTMVYSRFRQMMHSSTTSTSTEFTVAVESTAPLTYLLVHGDVRPVNIMINQACDGVQLLLSGGNDADNLFEIISNNIRLIDFDWCGIEGVAKYPSTINQKAFVALQESFPLRELLITNQHDMQMIQALFNSN